MSSKGVHVQDSSVLERRLRPIYDWLDGGNYKKAIQECEKLLKKSPHLDRARALKALSLLRLGKEAECIVILQALEALTPTDDAILQAMTMCYRELQQLDRVSKLYESAVKADPTNEELHTHLFMSYVRTNDFKQQQQAAMALYRLTPKNPYYCWAVMSVILQATRGDGASDPKKQSMLLSLAERMIDKMINKLEAEQEVQLYMMCLEEQGKYEKILEILNGPLGAKLSGDAIQNKLPFLLKLNHWSDANVLCKKTLTDSMDRWDVWKTYLQSVFTLWIGQTTTNNHANNHITAEIEEVDDTPEKAHEFICKLVEMGSPLRGPYLARFELYKHLSTHKDKSSSGDDGFNLLGDMLQLFMEYFRKFGHKPCCVSDLRNYLDLLNVDKQVELSSRIVKDVGISSTSVPQSEQQMQRHICALQLARLCGAHLELSSEHLRALVTALSFHYLHGHQTYGQGLLSTDQAPADAYTLLAAHLLYDLYRKEKSTDSLMFALVLLTHTLKNSPCNFHLKLLMLRIYHVMGCSLGAHVIYESLDVKHLQLDSMCYLHCARLTATACYALGAPLIDTSLKFFSSNYKDSSDHLTFSYKFGSFTKLTEFMDFRERMNNSFHYTAMAVDRLFFAVLQCYALDQISSCDTSISDPIDWDDRRDNSDLSVFVSWDPDRVQGPIEEWSETKSNHQQEMACLRLRIAVLDCVKAALNLIKHPSEVQRLRDAVKHWQRILTEVLEKDFKPVEQRLLCMPSPSRLTSHIYVYKSQLLPRVFEMIAAVAEEDVTKSEEAVVAVKIEFTALMEEAAATVYQECSEPDVFLHKRANSEYFNNVLEVCSVTCLAYVLCIELLKTTTGGKKVKKKLCDVKIREALTTLVTKMRKDLQKFDAALENYTDDHYKTHLANVLLTHLELKMASFNLPDEHEEGVADTVVESHILAMKELRTILRNKMKMLGS